MKKAIAQFWSSGILTGSQTGAVNPGSQTGFGAVAF